MNSDRKDEGCTNQIQKGKCTCDHEVNGSPSEVGADARSRDDSSTPIQIRIRDNKENGRWTQQQSTSGPISLSTLCMNKLMSSRPGFLLHYITYLQERVSRLDYEKKRLEEENARLRKVLIAPPPRRPSSISQPAFPSEKKQLVAVATECPTPPSTLVGTRDPSRAVISPSPPRQLLGSRNSFSMSMSQVEIGSPALVGGSVTGLMTMTSTSTPVLSLYSRNGQDQDQDENLPLLSSSSHSIVTLRQPTFLSSQNSTASINSYLDAEDPVVGMIAAEANVLREPDVWDIVVPTSPSLPSILQAADADESSSWSTVQSQSESQNRETYRLDQDHGPGSGEDEEGSHFPQFEKHTRHSWPIITRTLVISDFTAQLSAYLDDMASSTEGSDNDNESRTEFTGSRPSIDDSTNTLVGAHGSSGWTNYDGSSSEAEDLETQDPGIQNLFNSYENVGEESTTAPAPVQETQAQAIVEHPFQSLLRNSHNDVQEALMFREAANWNAYIAQLSQEQRIVEGQQLGRRQALTLSYTLNGSDREESFMGRLRSQLYYNVHLFVEDREFISPVDLAGNEDALDFVTDESDSSRDSSMIGGDPDSNEPDGDNPDVVTDEYYEILAEDGGGFGQQQEDEDAAPLLVEGPDSDSNESGSDSDTGQGDAEFPAVTISSSSTSAASYNATGQNTPNWTLPSTTNIGGGKYDYLRVTDRPRAAHGHRFVISVFGTTARRIKDARLPSWIPTHAERLECILNQYLHQEGGSSSSKSSGRSVLRSPSKDDFFFCRVRRNTSSIKKLKSCLKVSREGIVGETMIKVISWSEKVQQAMDNKMSRSNSPVDLNENVNNIHVADPDNTVGKTRSCPGIYCNENMRSSEDIEATECQVQGSTTSMKPLNLEVVAVTEPLKKKKKSGFANIFRRVRNCNNCSCIPTSSNTFKQKRFDSSESNRESN